MAVLTMGSHYTVSQVITNPGAVTNLIVHASATRPLAIVYAAIEPAQAALVTEAGAVARLVRKTAAGTYTAIAASLFWNHDNGSDALATAGHTASAEGTEATRIITKGWNSRVGMEWRPTPEEYIVLPAGVGNGFGIRSNVAPPAGAYNFVITFVEIG